MTYKDLKFINIKLPNDGFVYEKNYNYDGDLDITVDEVKLLNCDILGVLNVAGYKLAHHYNKNYQKTELRFMDEIKKVCVHIGFENYEPQGNGILESFKEIESRILEKKRATDKELHKLCLPQCGVCLNLRV